MFSFALSKLVRDAFYAEKNIDTKDHKTDLVTETDQETERIIKIHFKEKFPAHRYIFMMVLNV
jgi:fructose-1,6-bisphosphatase/inositol monophosphatase family enzyme